MLNRIVLVGRLCADPEERVTQSGVKLCRFRIAVNRVRRGQDGEDKADFFGVTCFGKTADFVLEYVGKGYQVAVDGRCEIDEYTDRDGNKRTAVNVVADGVHNLTPREQRDGAKAAQPEPRQSRPAARAPRDRDFDRDDDDPFSDR